MYRKIEEKRAVKCLIQHLKTLTTTTTMTILSLPLLHFFCAIKGQSGLVPTKILFLSFSLVFVNNIEENIIRQKKSEKHSIFWPKTCWCKCHKRNCNRNTKLNWTGHTQTCKQMDIAETKAWERDSIFHFMVKFIDALISQCGCACNFCRCDTLLYCLPVLYIFCVLYVVHTHARYRYQRQCGDEDDFTQIQSLSFPRWCRRRWHRLQANMSHVDTFNSIHIKRESRTTWWIAGKKTSIHALNWIWLENSSAYWEKESPKWVLGEKCEEKRE